MRRAMHQDHHLQLQRFELKYYVRPDTGRMIRHHVQSHLELDEYGQGQPNCSYAIHSLYLDSDRLKFFWHTINGNRNRFKLRLRFYDNSPASPVFFEIKRREGDIIRKQRAGVRRAAVPALLAGHLPHPDDLLDTDSESLAGVQNFCKLMQHHEARPMARVSYLREAWVNPDNNDLRVTLDRHVRAWPQHDATLSTNVPPGRPVFGDRAVLEIKFTGRFPHWLREMVHAFGLARESAAKYVMGINSVGPEHFTRFVPPMPVAVAAVG
jgi:hypothetical protein